MKQIVLPVLLVIALTSCSKPPESSSVLPKDKKSPELYKVALDTSKGPVVIEVHRDWAPLGADRFYTLVESGYLDQARFFRTLPHFMTQFGLAADPKVTARWEGTELVDDPVRQSNTRGMVTFAKRGPNTRTTQLFINVFDNSRLDADGFAPFGRVTSGIDNVDEFYNLYGNAPEQGMIKQQGNAYLAQAFPLLDYIKTARIVP